MSAPSATVFAVDDDTSVLKGLSRLLRSAGFKAEVFASAQAFLDAYRPDVTGCVILDLAMPGLDGMQVQQCLIDKGGALPIIFLTGHGDVPACARAMKQGAADFLTKPIDDERLLAAVEQATERCRMAQQERLEVATIGERLGTLTRRERQVLRHLLSGKLNKQIAAAIGTVEKTVKVHRARLMHKMQASTLAALVRMADRAGVSTDPDESDSPD